MTRLTGQETPVIDPKKRAHHTIPRRAMEGGGQEQVGTDQGCSELKRSGMGVAGEKCGQKPLLSFEGKGMGKAG